MRGIRNSAASAASAIVRARIFTSSSPCCGACRALFRSAGLSGRYLLRITGRGQQPRTRGLIELMLVGGRPGKSYVIAKGGPAEAVLPHRDWLSIDLAKHDAVGAEMLHAPDTSRPAILRHNADVLG